MSGPVEDPIARLNERVNLWRPSQDANGRELFVPAGEIAASIRFAPGRVASEALPEAPFAGAEAEIRAPCPVSRFWRLTWRGRMFRVLDQNPGPAFGRITLYLTEEETQDA